MDNVIILIINIFFLLLGIFKIKQVGSLEKLIINDKFWLYISWEACLLLYSISGIVYPISLKITTFLYIIVFSTGKVMGFLWMLEVMIR